MSTVYLLKYNNYYNRQVRRPLTNNDIPTYEDFINSGAVWLATYENINFKLGNRINQEIILNYDIQAHDEPDYCIVVEDDGSRTLWFILEIERTRKGQAKFALYRDLMNTYYNKIRSMKAFIEKGFVPSDNNLIFNSENMTYNQIKSGEILLSDEAKGPWIVGYIASDAENKENCTFGITKDKGVIEHTTETCDEFLAKFNKKAVNKDTIKYGVSAYVPYVQYLGYGYRWYDATKNSLEASVIYDSSANQCGLPIKAANYTTNKYDAWNNLDLIKDGKDGYKWTRYYNWDALYEDLVSKEDFVTKNYIENLLSFNGKIVHFNGGYYKIKYSTTASTKSGPIYYNTSDRLQTDLVSYFKSWVDYLGVYDSSNNKRQPLTRITYETFYYNVTAEEVSLPTVAEYTYNLKSSLKPLKDANYKMFVMPYFNEGYDFNGVGFNKELSLQWAMDIATKLGSNLYDIQMLPYCPLSLKIIVNESGKIVVYRDSDDKEDNQYFYLKKDGVNVAIAYMADVSTFKTTINQSINIENYKIESECNSYRICSPNYASVFEFNAAKNDGVDYFEAECTYKPYNPYICVHPRFKRLYGADYFDNRGLICAGDFSLPIVTDAWVQYEIQNKNYNQIFNRQIENLSVNNSIALQEAKWGIGAGVIQGGAQGAMTGAMAGGGWGAVAGGALGTVGSLTGGIMDYNNLLKRQQETIDYTVDQFGYQLGNIKALPNTLSNVGSLVANSKFIPFLEFYTCSDIEKEALKEKIKYNGMTVGIIGYINNYLSNLEETYIKAKPIRFDEDSLLWDIDYHEAIVLAEELNKGVYM